MNKLVYILFISLMIICQNCNSQKYVVLELATDSFKNYNIYFVEDMKSNQYVILSQKAEINSDINKRMIKVGDTLNIDIQKIQNKVILDGTVSIRYRPNNDVVSMWNNKEFTVNDTLVVDAYYSPQIIDKYIINKSK